MISKVRSRLGLKIFISYMVVIIIGMVVLAASAEFIIPTAFNRHMGSMMNQTGMMPSQMMGNDLYSNFRSAVTEALFRAGLVAFVAAVGMSIYISRRVVSPIHDMTRASQFIAEGHYDQRVGVPGDIGSGSLDELAELAISFNQMAETLAQTENMRRQLIGDVSHELRTPLTTIKGSMEGLLDGVLPPTGESFHAIYQQADRMQRLVDDLQELSRVEGDAVALEIAHGDIRALIDSVVCMLAPQYQEKGVSLDVNLPDSLPGVHIDENRISQVLINLLGNALQYTPEGGRVTVAVLHNAGEVQISVSDTGSGIPSEHLSHIFTRFYRVDKSRSRAGGGSGIGLTIAKHLVEAHGGSIRIESGGKDQGSTFTFTLPLER